MRRLAAFLSLTVTAVSPAAGQSFDEAVRANVALGTQLCLSVMIDQARPRPLFERAAFTYRGEDRGINEFGVDRGIDHYFDAPAGTAHVSLPEADAFAGLCQVLTQHLDEAGLQEVISAAIFPIFPGARVRTDDGFMLVIDTSFGLPLIVQTRTIDRHRYEEPGTVEVSMSYPG